MYTHREQHTRAEKAICGERWAAEMESEWRRMKEKNVQRQCSESRGRLNEKRWRWRWRWKSRENSSSSSRSSSCRVEKRRDTSVACSFSREREMTVEWKWMTTWSPWRGYKSVKKNANEESEWASPNERREVEKERASYVERKRERKRKSGERDGYNEVMLQVQNRRERERIERGKGRPSDGEEERQEVGTFAIEWRCNELSWGRVSWLAGRKKSTRGRIKKNECKRNGVCWQ